MSRKQFAISTGIVALLWTAVYVVAVMWVMDGSPAATPDRASILAVGTLLVASFTWPSMVAIRWVNADPSKD